MSQNDDIDELLRKLGDEDFSTIPENNFDIEKSTVTFTIPSKYGKLLNEG